MYPSRAVNIALLWRESYLIQATASTEEEIPFIVRDVSSLAHYFATQHEREHQLVLFKQTSEKQNSAVQ